MTGREVEVLDLVALGLTNKEIAYRLGIAQQTVKNHLASIYAGLGVSTRLEALVKSGRFVRPRGTSAVTGAGRRLALRRPPGTGRITWHGTRDTGLQRRRTSSSGRPTCASPWKEAQGL